MTVRQVHGNRVHLVARDGHPGEGDALVSARPGLLLGVLVADCAPVVLAGRAGGAVAVCHAGWRGLVAGVVEATVDALARHVPSREVLAWVGPCIGPGEFEIGSDVAARLDPAHVDHRGDRERPRFDLPGAIASRLVAAGLAAEHVETAGISTPSDPRTFSHRRDGPTTGRMLAFVGMRDRG